jgi:hypothetical protein
MYIVIREIAFLSVDINLKLFSTELHEVCPQLTFTLNLIAFSP